MVRSGRLAQTKRNRGVTRSARPGGQHKGISIMKIVIIVTAALVATLSVAAAADLPRKAAAGGGSANRKVPGGQISGWQVSGWQIPTARRD